MLTAAAVLALATACAPSVAPDTIMSIARAESGWSPTALHINTNGSADRGLMQINSANLARTGLTATTAFDPCASLRAAAEILAEDWRACPDGDERARMACTLSRYNTGSATAGVANGYAGRVLHAAAYVVPSIVALTPSQSSPPLPAPQPPQEPHAWDVWGGSDPASSSWDVWGSDARANARHPSSATGPSADASSRPSGGNQ